MYKRVTKRLLQLTSNHNNSRLRVITTRRNDDHNNNTINYYCCRLISTNNNNNNNSSNPSYYLDFKSTTKPHESTKFDYKEERLELEARLLRASLPHVVKFGWSESAMIVGARELGVSPSIIGSFSRKEAALVEFFMDHCLQRLVDRIDSGEEGLENLIPSERVAKLVRIRLEMQIPYISQWPQALSIQAQPSNVSTSFKQRAMLVDKVWHATGDEASDVEWYVKRTVLGGIYSATEIYMLTDSSPEFRDTWAFLNNRVKDAFDVTKTFEEAKYIAEAFGTGMDASLRGLVGSVSR